MGVSIEAANSSGMMDASASPNGRPGPREAAIELCHITTVPVTALRLMGPQLTWFQNRGYRVSVISSPGDELAELRNRLGVRTFAVPMQRAISPLADFVSIVRLLRILRRSRFDIVHVHTPKAALLGSIAATLAHVSNRVYTMRGLRYETQTGWFRLAMKTAERMICRLNRRVICVSHSLRTLAIEEGLVSQEKAVILGYGSSNGVDAERFARRASPEAVGKERERLGFAPNVPLAGFVGRLTRDKGIADLVEAFSAVRASGVDVNLLVVGDWDESDPVDETTRRKIASEPWIRHLGRVDRPEDFYEVMDLLVLPSYREGFPNAVIEAAACCVPAVGYAVTGVRDAIVQEKTGILVAPHDLKALAEGIRRLLADVTTRLDMGRAARARVEQDFQPERIWQSLEDEYDNILGRHENTLVDRLQSP